MLVLFFGLGDDGNESVSTISADYGAELISAAPADDSLGGADDSRHDSRTPVYLLQLQPDQLRLLRLSSVEDVDSPVHVDLEIYDDQRHPEYETVSYTWGGENGDSTPCRPIYVGRHWDVLVQTQNCWEMLRYLRPRRDIRTVWVDAICINQHDFYERENQVAKMGLIYERAARTSVYLGPDIVAPTSRLSPFPRRHYLQDLTTMSDPPRLPRSHIQSFEHVTLDILLSREYFQRVWVIQELLLSRDIMFGIGDVEFTIARRVSHPPVPEPWPTSSFHSTRVPWFRYITQGILTDEETPLVAAVSLVSRSKSADLRDMLFGVLGMPEHEERLTPSYSISFQHLAIGYYAYSLVVKKDFRVLVHAAGLRTSAGMPSWAPPVYKDGTKAPAICCLGIDKRESFFDWDNFASVYGRHHCLDGLGGDVYLHERSERWNAKDHSQTCWKVSHGENAMSSSDLHNDIFEFTKEINSCGPKRDWHSQIKVDSRTGALLNLTALHVLCFGQAELTLAETYHDEGTYNYVFRNETGLMFVYSKDACFEQPADSSETHLFALCDNSSSDVQPHHTFNSRLCILRSVVEKDAFQLVSANVYVCFHTQNFPTNADDTSDHSSWDDLYIKNMSATYMRLVHDDASRTAIPMIRRETVNQILGTSHWSDWNREPGKRRHRILPMQKLCGNLDSIIQQFRRSWVSRGDSPQECLRFLNFDGQLYPPNWICLAFPGIQNPRHYLRVLHAAFLVESGAKDAARSFLELYFNLVGKFKPRVCEGLPSSVNKGIRATVGSETLVELCFKPDQHHIVREVVNLMRGSHNHDTHLQTLWDITDDRVVDHHSALQVLGANEVVTPKFVVVHIDDRNDQLDRRRQRLTESRPWCERAKAKREAEVFLGEDFRPGHGRHTISRLRNMVLHSEYQNADIRIAFDLKMLMSWAQLHPCTMAFRSLAPYCQNGENELALFLKDPLHEEANVMVPWWPQVVDDCFGINKSACLSNIAVV